MKILLILAHPDPGSFNHALAAAVRDALRSDGHDLLVHDLCLEGFDAGLPRHELSRDTVLAEAVKAHCDELRTAEGLVFVHPNWWGQPPAVLKGWIDRVMRRGVAYCFREGDGGEGEPVGLLQARAALVLNTANTPELREREVFGDPLELIWKRCILGLCGVKEVHRRMFRVVVTSTAEERRSWLEEAVALARTAFGPGKSRGRGPGPAGEVGGMAVSGREKP